MPFKETKNMESHSPEQVKEKTTFNPDKRTRPEASVERDNSKPEKRFNPDKRVESGKYKGDSFKAEKHENYYSTMDERLYYAPNADRFKGEAGDSACMPKTEAVKQTLEKFRQKTIEYINGFPDFSKVTVDSVKIDHMTADRSENYKAAYEKMAEKWNKACKDGRTDWKPEDVKKWKQENKLALHECEDLKTVQFIPADVHNEFTHTGGCFEAKKRDGIGGKFDD